MQSSNTRLLTILHQFCCKARKKQQSTKEVERNIRQRLLFASVLRSCSTASCVLCNRTGHCRSRLIYQLNIFVFIIHCIIPTFLPGDDFPDHDSVYASTGGNQMNEDQPGTQESKQTALNGETAMNGVAISSSNSL